MKLAIILIGVFVLGVATYYFMVPNQAEAPALERDTVRDDRTGNVATVEVYDGIVVPVTTQVLDLSDKALTGSLKAEVRLLIGLRQLDISDNAFTGLPAEVGQLRSLEVLDLSNNQITGLPHELGNLSNLKRLDLRGTNYAAADLEVIKSGLPQSVEILVD